MQSWDWNPYLSKCAFPVLLGSTPNFNIEGTDILPPSNSQTLAGHPRIQLNSHTTCLDVESDSASKGFSPTKLPSALDTSGKPRLLLVLLMQLAINQMFPQHPPWVWTCLLIRLPISIKDIEGYKSTARWRDRCIEQGFKWRSFWPRGVWGLAWWLIREGNDTPL